MESKRDEGEAAVSPLGAVGAVNPGLINQLRQLSIPLWARCAAFMLAVCTLLLGIVLIAKGWLECSGIECTSQWLEQGSKIVVATFLPVIAIVYLVFAETGSKALVNKTDELLGKTLKDSLSSSGAGKLLFLEGAEVVSVEYEHEKGQPVAIYRITALRAGTQAFIVLLVELNVSKANVVAFIPCTPSENWQHNCAERFRPTLDGAFHEGYSVDKQIPVVILGGKPHFKLVIRKSLPETFLWDPTKKLHFAQDLRLYVLSLLEEGWDLFMQRDGR